MGWFNKFEDGSRTVLLVARSSAAIRTKFLISASVLVVAAGAGGWALIHLGTAKAEQQAAQSWSSLSHCLLGDEPKGNERPGLRFRGVQLAMMSRVEVERAAGKAAAWPERCAQHAHLLREGLAGAGRAEAGKQDLAYYAEKMFTVLRTEEAYRADLSDLIEETWKAAAETKLPPAATQPAQGELPEPVLALSIDAVQTSNLIANSAVDLRVVQQESDVSQSLRLLVEGKSGSEAPSACTLSDDSNGVSCAPLAVEIPGPELGLRLLGSAEEGADPLIFVGTRGAEGIYRAESGDKIAASAALGGYASADGFSALLAWDDRARRLSLVRKTGSAAAQQIPLVIDARLRPAEPSRDVRMLWNHLVVRGTNRFGETWLAAMDVQQGPVATGPMTEIGMLAESGATRGDADRTPAITGCRSDKVTVVRVRGDANEFLSFRVGDRWTKPVKAAGIGGSMTCHRAEASLTRIDAVRGEGMLGSVITQQRCRPASCETQRLTLSAMLAGSLGLAPLDSYLVGDLGGKLLVIWRGGERGGVRMRLAPIREIKQAQDVVLFDDLVEGGRVQTVSTLSDMQLFVRDRRALVLLSTTGGTFGITIDRDGNHAVASVKRVD